MVEIRIPYAFLWSLKSYEIVGCEAITTLWHSALIRYQRASENVGKKQRAERPKRTKMLTGKHTNCGKTRVCMNENSSPHQFTCWGSVCSHGYVTLRGSIKFARRTPGIQSKTNHDGICTMRGCLFSRSRRHQYFQRAIRSRRLLAPEIKRNKGETKYHRKQSVLKLYFARFFSLHRLIDN